MDWGGAKGTLYISITIVCLDVVLMLGQRRRRWANIKTTLVQQILVIGYLYPWQFPATTFLGFFLLLLVHDPLIVAQRYIVF